MTTRWHALELLTLTLLAAAAAAGLQWAGGPAGGAWGWTWDALNHHVYLGLIAEHPRWDRDVLAASYQSYQHPYLYWPVYRIAMLSGDGRVFAAAWTAAQAAMLLPPVWLASLHLLQRPGVPAWEAAALRALACFLAGLNGVVLLGLQPSSNDIMAALPMLWGVALHLGCPASDRRAAWAGALWGVSVSLKLSNGLMLPLLLFWAWHPARPHLRWRRALGVGLAALIGFALAWAPWGVQLWHATGNPFYPYFRSWLGGYGA